MLEIAIGLRELVRVVSHLSNRNDSLSLNSTILKIWLGIASEPMANINFDDFDEAFVTIGA